MFQYWMYSKTGEIRRDETCLDYSGRDVVLYPCHGAKGNQMWLYDPGVSILYLLYITYSFAHFEVLDVSPFLF